MYRKDFSEKIVDYKKRIGYVEVLKKAKDTDSCQKCGKCCHIRPCCLQAQDIEKIATHLKISATELFNKYLLVDWFSMGGRGYNILPIRACQEGMAGGSDTIEGAFAFSPCVFYDTKLNICSIHEVKPIEGRLVSCWKGSIPDSQFRIFAKRSGLVFTKEFLITLGWKGAKDD